VNVAPLSADLVFKPEKQTDD